jgi:hypothetical protein
VPTRQPQPTKDSAKELLEVFEAAVIRLKAAIADSDAANLGETWTMRLGSRVLVSEPRGLLMRLMDSTGFLATFWRRAIDAIIVRRYRHR